MEGHAHNDMLSPYSTLAPPSTARKSHSKSPRRPSNEAKSSTPEKNRELTDFLTSDGKSINYPLLISDAIAKVDESLLKSCKKEGQVGGMLSADARALNLTFARETSSNLSVFLQAQLYCLVFWINLLFG